LEPEHSWTAAEFEELGDQSPSPVQWAVLLVHLISGIGISAYTYIFDIGFWFVGLGLVAPILLASLGIIFWLMPNENWYRSEMVPYLTRKLMPREGQLERFLQYHRRLRILLYILGWVAVLVCQSLWTCAAMLMIPLVAVQRLFGDLLILVMIGAVLLFLAMIVGILTLSERLLESTTSDIKHIIEFENEWRAEIQRREKERTEEEKQRGRDRRWRKRMPLHW
jgi:hypothetical protein